LTRKQFESFIINLFGTQFSTRSGGRIRKLRTRTDIFKISRGAFNRTLNQAKVNVVRSIYTLFLLGYVGVFDTPQLGPFIELADNIKAHLEDRRAAAEHAGDEEYKRAVQDMATKLAELIETLAEHSASAGEL